MKLLNNKELERVNSKIHGNFLNQPSRYRFLTYFGHFKSKAYIGNR